MESKNGVATKKSRIWNPALDDCHEMIESDKTESQAQVNLQYSSVFQNHVRPMQSYFTVMQPDYSNALQPNGTILRFQPNITPLSTYPVNPIMNFNFMPITVPNQNCCAACGSAFRLTTELVQHMRANHRTSHYLRAQKKLPQ